MSETKTVKLSNSCRLEVNYWDSCSPYASIIYTEHGDGWSGDHETEAPITLEEALQMAGELNSYAAALQVYRLKERKP